MSAALLLVASPSVYTDKPDEIPELMGDLREMDPEAVILLLPRGLASPARIWYLSHIADRLRDLHYTVEHRELRIDGKKQRVIVGQANDRKRRPAFREDLGQLILANQ